MANAVVVTGASRGIGRAVALALAAQRYDLVLVARSADPLESVAAECRAAGVDARTAQIDITRPEAGDELLNVLDSPPWGLVNNAGLAESAPLGLTDDELLSKHFELNVAAPMRLTRALVPLMTAAGGRVVNILSTAALAGYPYVSAYAASKHALLGATRSLAREFATKGVTFNAVCPGYVQTEMLERTIANIAKKTGSPPEQALDKLKALTPQRRIFGMGEVAHAVAFLLSPDSGGITGQALSIDGGEIEH